MGFADDGYFDPLYDAVHRKFPGRKTLYISWSKEQVLEELDRDYETVSGSCILTGSFQSLYNPGNNTVENRVKMTVNPGIT